MRKATRPQRRIVIASVGAAGAALLVAVLVMNRGSDRSPTCRNTLIPAYLSPPEIVAAVKGSIRARVIVVNPHNGPGAEQDDRYRSAVRTAQRVGARVLGYVHTDYGARPAGEVAADIDRYAQWYGVDGIFLDEAGKRCHPAALLPSGSRPHPRVGRAARGRQSGRRARALGTSTWPT